MYFKYVQYMPKVFMHFLMHFFFISSTFNFKDKYTKLSDMNMILYFFP